MFNTTLARTKQILDWGWKTFSPDIATLSSFQTQGMPLLHIISLVCPDMKVIFIDTGFHFQETLIFKDKIMREFGLNVVIMKTKLCRCTTIENQLFFKDPDLCCALNKVEPMTRAIESLSLSALISGIRKDQTETRSKRGEIELLESGLIRVHPIINWSGDDIRAYIERYNLPTHPLTEYGYQSIGCAPCTCPTMPEEGERAGRWFNRNKVECGLHDS